MCPCGSVIAPGPLPPELSENVPKLLATTLNEAAALVPPAVVTVRVALPAAMLDGRSALICPDEARKMSACAVVLPDVILTLVPPRVAGIGYVVACTYCAGPRFVPKMPKIEPCAMAPLGRSA